MVSQGHQKENRHVGVPPMTPAHPRARRRVRASGHDRLKNTWCVLNSELDRMWLWVKNRCPKWNPGKWKHGLKPAVPWCLSLAEVRGFDRDSGRGLCRGVSGVRILRNRLRLFQGFWGMTHLRASENHWGRKFPEAKIPSSCDYASVRLRLCLQFQMRKCA